MLQQLEISLDRTNSLHWSRFDVYDNCVCVLFYNKEQTVETEHKNYTNIRIPRCVDIEIDKFALE